MNKHHRCSNETVNHYYQAQRNPCYYDRLNSHPGIHMRIKRRPNYSMILCKYLPKRYFETQKKILAFAPADSYIAMDHL